MKRLYQNQVSAAAWVCAAIAFTLVLFALAMRGQLSVWIAIPVATGIAYFCGYRMGRGGVVADEHGVRIRNPVRTTRRISWSEISRWVLDDWGRVAEVVYVELKTGERFPVAMLDASPINSLQKPIRRIVDDLNAELGQRDGARMTNTQQRGA